MRESVLPIAMLVWRENLRFFRQPSRLIGALATPLLFWLFLGSGLSASFQAEGRNYLSYSFPGMLALVILFSSIFSMMSLIQDRNEGFLQGVLVAPIPRAAIAAGKIAGATSLALFQALLFLCLAPLAGYLLSPGSFLLALAVMGLISFSLASLGFVFAWKINSVQGFHGIMNIVLFPMWFLSGALFPLEGAPLWLKLLMTLNPLTYGVRLLKYALELPTAASLAVPVSSSFWLPLAISLLMGIVFYAAALVVLLKSKRSVV